MPTWESLCKALRAPAVDEGAIARQIEDERMPRDGGGGGDGDVDMSSETTEQSSVRVKTGKTLY